jgi:hypothetical protein
VGISEVVNTSGRSFVSSLTSNYRYRARASLARSTRPSPKIHTYRSMTQIPLAEKVPKEGIAAVLCANAEESHVLKPVVVGKVRQPCALKGLTGQAARALQLSEECVFDVLTSYISCRWGLNTEKCDVMRYVTIHQSQHSCQG